MRVRLLPSNLSDPSHLQPLTTFLINDTLATDGGSLGFALDLDSQRAVRAIVVTHTHTDHTASLPIFIAEVFPFLKEPISLYSTAEIIDGLRKHVFNDTIWPDFHKIILPNGNEASLRYSEIEPMVSFEAEDLRVMLVPVNHVVPTVGVVVEDDHSAVIVTSDTYHTEEIWRVANATEHLKAVFVDVSYPNEMEALAAVSKHLTPQALDIELGKMNREPRVYAVHLKPQFRSQVVQQLARMNRPNVSVCEIGREYVF
jgi:cAMP phosphodiesterase